MSLLLCLSLLFFCTIDFSDRSRANTMAQGDIMPLLLPDKFDGNRNYEDWVNHFECVSMINGWNEG